MPIIGIIDSQKSGHLTPASDFVLLGRATASTSVSSLIVSGLDQSWTNLEIWIQCRTDRGAINDAVIATFNGVGSGVQNMWANNEANGNGSIYAARGTSTTSWNMFAGEIPGGSGSTAGVFGFTILTLFDYSSTTKRKSAYFLGGNNQNQTAGATGAANYTWHTIGWDTTAAVSSIVLTPSTGPNFVAGSIVSVYGAK